jgi:hypothetical protein
LQFWRADAYFLCRSCPERYRLALGVDKVKLEDKSFAMYDDNGDIIDCSWDLNASDLTDADRERIRAYRRGEIDPEQLTRPLLY